MNTISRVEVLVWPGISCHWNSWQEESALEYFPTKIFCYPDILDKSLHEILSAEFFFYRH